MIPYQIAYGTLSSLIILYVLDIGGTVLSASYAVAFSNLLWILASIFWGKVVEVYSKRKIFITISLVGLSASLVALFAIRSVIGVIVVYGILTFFVIANSMPFNLLVMETNPKEKWASGFSRLQMFSTIGVVLGFLITSFLSGFLSLDYVILLLAPFAMAAIIFTKFIKEPKSAFPRLTIFSSILAFRSRLLSNPMIFLKIPGLSLITRQANKTFSGKISLFEKGQYINVLYGAVLIFYIGTTIFNTSYPAGLKASGFSNFEILAVLLVGNIAQAMTFYKSGILTERRIKAQVATSSMFARGIGYMLIGITFLTVSNMVLLGTNLILYSISAGIAYALFYTSFNTMVFEAVGTDNRSSKLGIYSGFVGLGALFGAPLAGYISYYIGYWMAFILAGVLMLAAAGIVIIGKRHMHSSS